MWCWLCGQRAASLSACLNEQMRVRGASWPRHSRRWPNKDRLQHVGREETGALCWHGRASRILWRLLKGFCPSSQSHCVSRQSACFTVQLHVLHKAFCEKVHVRGKVVDVTERVWTLFILHLRFALQALNWCWYYLPTDVRAEKAQILWSQTLPATRGEESMQVS